MYDKMYEYGRYKELIELYFNFEINRIDYLFLTFPL